MLHNPGDLLRVTAVDLVDLLGELAVRLHEARIEPVFFGEPFHVIHRDAAGVQVVRARGQDVFARRRRFRRDARIDVGIEEHRLEPREHRVKRLAVLRREGRARRLRRPGRGGEGIGRRLQHELPRGEVVVGAVVDPEVLRVALNLRERRGIDPLRMRDDLVEDASHLERRAVLLIDEDVAPGERRLVQVPDQRLLAQRQRVEAVRVQLHGRRVVHALEQILPGFGIRGSRFGRCRGRGRR